MPESDASFPTELPFTVHAALFRELGERLVGKPHIALAELIKNSYDADAQNVLIKFGHDSIEVIDDGHGMTFDEFRMFWMRIGSPHKQAQVVSRQLNRPLTGSKGIGRLAVQFLAHRVDVTTTVDDSERELRAAVNWDEAVGAGDVTNAKAYLGEGVRSRNYAQGATHGTSILLRDLRHPWMPGSIAEIATEIRDLEAPFRPNPAVRSQEAFHVEVKSPDESAVTAFRATLNAYLDRWYARAIGKLIARDPKSRTATIALVVEYAEGYRETTEYLVEDVAISAVEFEIRVYYLANRQGRGVRVKEARTYLRRFGGVHIYDAGFHLPYYGPETDWLNIERDHSARLSNSSLLPEELRVERGLNFLPTQARLFGVVHVDTSFERAAADASDSVLTMQVTRDRLVTNQAYESLRTIVRWAIDYYAMVEARRAVRDANASLDAAGGANDEESAAVIARRYRGFLPGPVYKRLQRELSSHDAAVAAGRAAEETRIGLLAALATAGIAGVAFDHELSKQLLSLDGLIDKLAGLAQSKRPTIKAINELSVLLQAWRDRATSTRALFSNVADETNRTLSQRLNARAVVKAVAGQLRPIMRNVEVATGEMNGTVLLPEATFAEWSAVIQNVLLNALNAMMDSEEKRIDISTKVNGSIRALVIQDTGVGVHLEGADKLFEPFERRSRITPQRRALGLGGTGLGLTIVRMIATNRHCTVRFVAPADGFRTAIRLEWREAS